MVYQENQDHQVLKGLKVLLGCQAIKDHQENLARLSMGLLLDLQVHLGHLVLKVEPKFFAAGIFTWEYFSLHNLIFNVQLCFRSSWSSRT